AATAASGETGAGRLSDLPLGTGGVHGIFQAGALLFFAFAGYARIATLGEEVRDPARTIPRAIPIALGLTVVLYAAVGLAALLAAGPAALAAPATPIKTAVEAVDASGAVPAGPLGRVVPTLAPPPPLI